MKLYRLTISIFLISILFLSPEQIFGQDQKLVRILPARRDTTLNWYDARDLGISGRGWSETERDFERLPAKAETMVPERVWQLSHHTSGLNVKFVTNASEVHARWTLKNENLAMAHMPATGVSGLDLYVKTDNGVWRWLGVGRPFSIPANTAKLAGNLIPMARSYMLYLPLYNGVDSLEIGLPEDASLWRIIEDEETRKKPIVFYGTSITQGGCASRPGMSATAILGRRLNLSVINLGFSGRGKMEPELATILGEIDAALYIIDCMPNMNTDLIMERVEPFIEILRKTRPEIPILLVEGREFQNSYLNNFLDKQIKQERAAFREAYENLLGKGIKNLHYLHGTNQLGDDYEATVDGSHPTDLGFMRQADFFEPVIRSILEKED